MGAVVKTIPVSAVIATCNRSKFLSKTMESVGLQSVHPSELIVVDASDGNNTRELCHQLVEENTSPFIVYKRTSQKGAAIQRNQGVASAKFEYIWFLDDDVRLEETCLERMWRVIQISEMAGGVNAMITNQQYYSPGTVTRVMYRLMSGVSLSTYAGKCIGPAWNVLPQDDDHLPEIVPVEWLNTTCTLYKKAALPRPVFDVHFTGYSLMEDLALSLKVGQKWKLYNARTARIFHDSQPGTHKNNIKDMAKMELVNRYYVMNKILNRKGVRNILKLVIFELFGIISTLKTWKSFKDIPGVILGKLMGVLALRKII